ncbi:MAG: class I SAM-dependent methyltransferase [Pirellulaceae bacterium]
MGEQHSYQVWRDPALAVKFLEGIRGGVPFAADQIDLMLRVVQAARVQVARLLDIGCGDGILGRALLDRFPQAHGTFLDFSEAMVAAARNQLQPYAHRCQVVPGDFGRAEWGEVVEAYGPFDVVVSGYAIHHQTDERKRALYGEIHGLLAPHGLFLNMEHVASCCAWTEQAFNDMLIDSLWAYHQRQGAPLTRDDVARQFVQRADWSANILAPLDDQLQWLRDIGYVDVDCFFKALELTLFGGRKGSPA